MFQELCLAYLSRVASSRYIQEMTRTLGPDHHHQDAFQEDQGALDCDAAPTSCFDLRGEFCHQSLFLTWSS